MRIRRSLPLWMIATLCLAPSVAWANGFARVEAGLNLTFWSAVIGCLAGLVVALFRRVRVGGVFGWTIGVSLGLGLGVASLFVMGNARFFFPNNAGFALVMAVSAVLVAGVGGALLAAVAVGIRSCRRSKGGSDKPQPLP